MVTSGEDGRTPVTEADERCREMVERDLIGRGIADPRVLDAVRRVPRHLFWDGHEGVDTSTGHPNQLARAYADHPLPIGCGQTISQPYIVALTAELLQLSPTDRVLDVGTGSGYAAAVLSLLANEVWSIERHPQLAAEATTRLRRLGYDNVHVTTGDGSRGWPEAAPFDAIAVAAAAHELPAALTEQLCDEGRLVIPVGASGHGQDLVLVERRGRQFEHRTIIPVRFVPLVVDHPTDAAPQTGSEAGSGSG